VGAVFVVALSSFLFPANDNSLLADSVEAALIGCVAIPLLWLLFRGLEA
jgi:hypothetical protein